MSPKKPQNALRVDVYAVLRRAVEDGVARGWRYAHKHTDTPQPEAVQEQIINAIMGEVCDVFKFDDT